MRCAFCNNPSAELLANNLGVAYGQKIERERIIKLLEDNWVEPMDWLSALALIKGENK
jgi:hypothetical protein